MIVKEKVTNFYEMAGVPVINHFVDINSMVELRGHIEKIKQK
jgi:hypothetical protein